MLGFFRRVLGVDKRPDKRIKVAFSKIKEEFEEHLDTINQNTNEIQANYEYLCEVEAKVDRLCQRLDEIQMYFSESRPVRFVMQTPIKKLSKREQEVFMAMYASEDLTYADLARKLGLKEDMVRSYITALSSKGVPIVKRFVSNKILLSVDPDFLALQAKENILGIDEVSAKQYV